MEGRAGSTGRGEHEAAAGSAGDEVGSTGRRVAGASEGTAAEDEPGFTGRGVPGPAAWLAAEDGADIAGRGVAGTAAEPGRTTPRSV